MLVFPFAMRLFRFVIIVGAASAAACGGGGSAGPTAPTAPTATPTPNVRTVNVQGAVFYDEDGGGQLDGNEAVRLPSLTVSIGGRTTVTTAGGRFSFDAPEGAQQATIVESSLPYGWQVTARSVTLPVNGDLLLPVTLPIGRNRPNLYMAFGDSITSGDGSRGGVGYLPWTEDVLRNTWGRGALANEGVAGTRSDRGAERLGASLASVRPAYVLILYGTNDWNSSSCRDSFPCYTIDSLRSMIGQAKAFGSVPVVATIPPVNPTYSDREPENRNAWVKRMNELIVSMARSEGVALADIHAAMSRQPNLADLFFDFLHPNDSGYEVIGREFARAIMAPRGTTSTSGGL